MRVDGSTSAGALPIGRPPRTGTQTPPQRTHVSEAAHLTARESRLSSGVSVEQAARAIAALRDSFQRASPLQRTGEVSAPVISGAFETTRATVAEPPRAEIPDLETTSQARGLPLIAEPYHDGPAFNTLLEAYRDPGHGSSDLLGSVEPGDGFDTRG